MRVFRHVLHHRSDLVGGFVCLKYLSQHIQASKIFFCSRFCYHHCIGFVERRSGVPFDRWQREHLEKS